MDVFWRREDIYNIDGPRWMKDELVGGLVDGWMDEWISRWIDGWMDQARAPAGRCKGVQLHSLDFAFQYFSEHYIHAKCLTRKSR